MRFIAPARSEVSPDLIAHPAFDALAPHRDLLGARAWPTLADLNERLGSRLHPISQRTLRFVAQSQALLADKMHYETRIFERGEIATRAENWHDLLNALIWIEQTPLKAASNARQARDIARVGSKRRTLGQCALTHFDEAGALVVLDDERLFAAWDQHDWHELFWAQRDAWRVPPSAAGHSLRTPGARVLIFGHALLEHLLRPRLTLVAKALVLRIEDVGDPSALRSAMLRAAEAIAAGTALTDPQQLCPLPISGIPGWHAENGDVAFYRAAPCFRPKPKGRRYPAPL
jgi:hypothetical protein